MQGRQTTILIVFILLAAQSFAQPYHWMGKKRPYTWQFGLGWNAVDDDGRDVCQPFDAKQSWNMPAFPSRFMADRYLKKGLSVEFAGAYNRYKQGKLINDSTNRSGMFLSFDLNTKLSFLQMLPTDLVDPYVSLGLGVTHRDAYTHTLTGTLNVGIGINIWFLKSWGVQLQSSGKLGINGKFFASDADYIQHSIGVVYRLPEIRYSNSFNKRQHSWVSKSKKYNNRGGRRAG